MNKLLKHFRNARPWKKGKLMGQKAPLTAQEVWSIRMRLQDEGRTRDLALFNLAIDSKLRACDLLQIKFADISSGGRINESPHLSTLQYAQIVDTWVAWIGLDPTSYGTHSLRRTKNLRAVQLLLSHTNLDSTVRYLGIEIDDALEISEQTDV